MAEFWRGFIYGFLIASSPWVIMVGLWAAWRAIKRANPNM